MARVYSHRRGSSQKKALPMEAIYAAVASAISIVAFFAIISVSAYSAGENSRWIGGIGVLAFVVAISAFVFNIKQMQTATDLRYRIGCMAISSIALVLWAITFITGMVS